MELETGKPSERADITDYLSNLPDTPRKYLSREVPIYLDNRKSTVSALAEKVGISRNSLSSIVNSNNIDANIDANIAGCLIQEVAPSGLHRKVLEKYYPWIKESVQGPQPEDAFDTELMAGLLNDPIAYSIYNQANMGDGITSEEILAQWKEAGESKAASLVQLGLLKEESLENSSSRYTTLAHNFRTLSDDHILSRINSCMKYMEKYDQKRPVRTTAAVTGLFDSEAQKEIRLAFFDYIKKVFEIRGRKMGPDAKKMFMCYFTGDFFPQEKEV